METGQLNSAVTASDAPKSGSSPALLVLAWLGVLVLLLFALGTPPVIRTQEARVMETGREMLDRFQSGHGIDAWLIPYCNGSVRLQKPPLAYWMTAASFKIFGVSDRAGRLPMAIMAWLIVGLTYHISARSFNSRTGLLAAAALLGSFLFYKNSRLAETDVVITLFVGIAIYAIGRGFDSVRPIVWFQLSGLAIGLTILGKGGPGAFPLIYLIALAAIEKRWRTLLIWIVSGAPLIAAAIGAPWWLYVRSLPTWNAVMLDEAGDLFEGRDHAAWFWVYLPLILKAVLPWSGFLPVAVVDALRRCRIDPDVRRVLLWSGAILVPLCVIGNKQDHYLMPLLPPLAILTGVWIERSTRRFGVDQTAMCLARGIFIVTVTLTMLAALALPLAAQKSRGNMLKIDAVVAAFILLGAAVVWRVYARQGLRNSITVYAILCAVSVAPLLGMWAPSLRPIKPNDLAAQIRTHGGGSYVFYGDNFSLPLVFALRTVIPQARSADALVAQAAGSPGLLVIVQTKSDRQPPAVPAGFERIAEIRPGEQRFELYRIGR